MKKILFFGALAALLLGTASCSSDMEPTMGGEMPVSFSVSLGDNIDSRTISDGLKANQLKFAVFENGTEIPKLAQTVDVVDKKATVTTRLVKGHTYKFVFWAQNSQCTAYNTENMAAIKVNYETVNCNDESRDAFYKMDEVTVTEAFERTEVLTRPFAQINFLASDAAGVVNVDQYQSQVTVTGVPTTLNTLEGTVADPTEVTTYVYTTIPKETLEGYETYKYVAMNYVLATTNKEMKNEVTLTVKDENGAEVNTVTVANCPVQRNYRTNIFGDLFTLQGKFNIVIDPIYNTPDNNVDIYGRPYLAAGKIQVGVAGEQYTTLAEAIAAANGKTVYLGAGTYDEAITATDGQTVSIASAGGLTAADVTIPQQIKAENGATLNINGVTVKTSGTNDSANNAAIYVISSTATIQNVSTEGQRGINVEGGSTVTIEGCDLNANIGEYQRGINVIGENNDINVKNSTVKAGWYAFNFVSSASNNTVVLDNANVIGWACFNFWANGNNISATNCEFTSINDKTVHASNTFAAVKFENSASNNVLTIDKSNVLVESKNANKQYLILFGGNDNTVNCTSVNVTGRNTNTEGHYIAKIQGCGNYNINLDDACTIDWE